MAARMVQHGFAWIPNAPRVTVAGVAFVAVLAAACDRMPLLAPTGSAITLVASTTSLSTSGVTDITAVVTEGAQGGTTDEGGQVIVGGGTPVHDGTLVIFATSLGRIEPSEAQTKGGRATARLVADGRSGTATVTAISGAVVSKIEIDIGAATATRIAVTANPQALPSTGGSSLITARVEDQQGNGVSGIVVSFSTTRGTLNPVTATTNDQGLAQTTLTTFAAATVTATSGGSATALNGTVTVSID